jgi:predicted N-formylglutamate amidohydrolase
MDDAATPLIAADEPGPLAISNEDGWSPFVIVADHAGRYLPRRLQMLGLGQADRERHIAWDIGAGAVSLLIGDALGAPVIRQNYSRLVIDCNRTPGTETSIVESSELTPVPGNIGLSNAAKEVRAREIFRPYHAGIARVLDRRQQADRATALIAVHSFTPVFMTAARPWHIGVLYNRDSRLAGKIIDLLRREEEILVGDNEPYSVSDASDFTIPVHGERRNLPHVAIEIRQDLIADDRGQRKWGSLLARLLPRIYP